MEKFFRYIFIVLAILFVGFFLSPSDRHRAAPQGFYSPVDGTNAAEFLYFYNGARRVEDAYHLRNECRSRREYCGIHPFGYGGSLDKIVDLSDSFSKKSIEYKEAKEELYKEWFETKKGVPFYDLPGLQRVYQLGEPLYEDYLNSQRVVIKYLTWGLNIIFILIGIALIMLRAKMARLMCKLLGVSAAIAGKVHDNV